MMTDEAAIRALTAEFVTAFNEADVDRMMRLYAERYIDINLPQPVQTHGERAEYYRNIVARRDLRIEVVADEIIVDAAHAMVRGSIRVIKIDDTSIRALRYVEIWERRSAGWKSIWGIDAEVHKP